MLLSPSFSGKYKHVSSKKGDIPYTVTNVYRPQRKLREGNVFTPVCHSVHKGRVSASGSGGGCLPLGPGGVHPPGQTPPRQTPPWADTHLGRHPPVEMTIEAGGTHPTGMHSCFNLFSSQRG